jgi:hypothetical protein
MGARNCRDALGRLRMAPRTVSVCSNSDCFIDRIAAGTMQRVHEARVHVTVQDEFIRVRMKFRELPPREFEPLPVRSAGTVVGIVRKVISFLRKSVRGVRHDD